MARKYTNYTHLAKDEDNFGQLAQTDGFSLHAGVFAPIAGNSCRAPSLNPSIQLPLLDDSEIQRDFDFGA